MSFSLKQAMLWITLYLVLASAPLLIAFAGPLPPANNFWTEFAVGLGFVGLAMLGWQFVLTGRFKNVAASLGLDTMLQFHRQAGLIAVLFILAHPLILFATRPAYLAFIDPRVDLPRAIMLSGTIGALLVIVVTTFWRQRLGLSYEWWRLLHGLLALMVVVLGLVHILQIGFYVSGAWKPALWVGMTGAATLILFYTRVLMPLRLRSNSYRVVEVRDEHGPTWTLVLEPEGHSGMRFAPGQYAWLTLGPSPFSLQQHPFSFSSSAEQPARIDLTIKALGDFSSTVGTVPVGTRAYLEGPYGALTPGTDPTVGAVFIVGGVGITPVMSMLRTFRDRADPRPLLLIYGNGNWEEVLFREEIEALEDGLNLTVVHALTEVPPDWQGEVGRITPSLLDRYLPDPRRERREYFLCGPEPMMDAVEAYLRRRGVPMRDIHSERFKIV
jgi:predicted ferric reductase